MGQQIEYVLRYRSRARHAELDAVVLAVVEGTALDGIAGRIVVVVIDLRYGDLLVLHRPLFDEHPSAQYRSGYLLPIPVVCVESRHGERVDPSANDNGIEVVVALVLEPGDGISEHEDVAVGYCRHILYGREAAYVHDVDQFLVGIEQSGHLVRHYAASEYLHLSVRVDGLFGILRQLYGLGIGRMEHDVVCGPIGPRKALLRPPYEIVVAVREICGDGSCKVSVGEGDPVAVVGLMVLRRPAVHLRYIYVYGFFRQHVHVHLIGAHELRGYGDVSGDLLGNSRPALEGVEVCVRGL